MFRIAARYFIWHTWITEEVYCMCNGNFPKFQTSVDRENQIKICEQDKVDKSHVIFFLENYF